MFWMYLQNKNFSIVGEQFYVNKVRYEVCLTKKKNSKEPFYIREAITEKYISTLFSQRYSNQFYEYKFSIIEKEKGIKTFYILRFIEKERKFIIKKGNTKEI